MTTITITNNITGQQFFFYVEVVNMTQLYARVRVLMTQISIIENINENNVSHTITSPLLAA